MPIEHASDYSPEEMFKKMHPEMGEELKPCPFCEETEMLRVELSVGLHCDGCGLFVEFEGGNYELIVNKWNTRPIEDVLKDKLDEANGRTLQYSYQVGEGNVEILALKHQLNKAKDVIMTLLHHLPDSEHDDGDESWQWCWEELSSEAQDKVKIARRYAEVYSEEA